jgi:hypothetical protein
LPVSSLLKFHMKNCCYTKVAHFPANRCHTSTCSAQTRISSTLSL